MVTKLPSTFRWGVSGTPIKRTLHDLFYLFYFLDHPAFTTQTAFTKLIAHPLNKGDEADKKRVAEFLKQYMWRNSKATVADELTIPQQHEHVFALSFSAVESYFYKKEYENCKAEMSAQMAKIRKARNVDQKQKTRLQTPLFK